MFDLITSIVVDLSDQKLYAYNGAELVRAIAVSSGKAGTPTPTFSSQVQSKHETVTMRGRDYVAPGVPWALCLDGGMICLHGGPPGRRPPGRPLACPAAMAVCAWPPSKPNGSTNGLTPAPR
jgi:hypothetical protein